MAKLEKFLLTALLTVALCGTLVLAGGCGNAQSPAGEASDTVSSGAAPADSDGETASADGSEVGAAETDGDASSAAANGEDDDAAADGNAKDAAADTEASKDVFAMDTYMTLQAYGAHGEEAVEAAAEEIERLDALLSTGNAESEVSRLNENGGGALSADTAYLLERALAVFQDTDGAFDITVYPLMQLWGFTTRQFQVPSEADIQETLKLVGSDALKLESGADGQTLAMEKDGAEIDFGGIAKGYTSDRILEIYKECGVTSGIISLGGNVAALGLKPDGTKWRIAVRDPEDENDFLGVLSIENKAVITSGGYERYFEEDGVTYHHILDASTGYPANNGLISVTIISSDGTLADALSTALFVMGTDRAIAYCGEHAAKDGFDAVLCSGDGVLYVTEGIVSDFSAGGSRKQETIQSK